MRQKILSFLCLLVISLIFAFSPGSASHLIWPLFEFVLPDLLWAEVVSDTDPIPDQLPVSTPKKPDLDYSISVESVEHRLKEGQGIVLIDVRSKKAFEAFSVPGSLNIPLFAIKTKPFLKSQLLVLLNEGYNDGELERECEQLADSGFNVRILKGGLYYWRQKGGSLKGDPFSQRELNKMPPGVFFVERHDQSWLVIDVSSPKSPEAKGLIPSAISVPFSGDQREFVLSLKKNLATHNNSQECSLLLYNDEGEKYDSIEKCLHDAGLNAFFLKGGIKAYKNFLERQATMKEAKHNSKTVVEECPTCR
jgi:rhodanese-related sulfurtransferase